MKRRALACLLPLACLLAACSAPAVQAPIVPEPPVTAPPESCAPVAAPAPTSENAAGTFVLSFAGDCTLASEHAENAAGSFVNTVGDNYAYPFEYAAAFFKSDDFSLVNLECALTESDAAEDKLFRFRGPPAYAKILTTGGVECVNLANNHSGDYGEAGLADTKAALDEQGVVWAGDGDTCLYETASGLRIGLYAVYADFRIAEGIAALREAGAEIVIVSLHFGEEGSYTPSDSQTYWARYAIDSGADIVYGHHPHVLQPIEPYNGGVIFYSLGNFSFGGNGNPRDKDTAIIQQTIVRDAQGNCTLGQTRAIPFSLSGYTYYNDYRPVPYMPGSEDYARTLSKLDGSFTGENLPVEYDRAAE